MATRERAADRGRRRASDDLRRVGLEIRQSRLASGLSLRAIGEAARVDHVQLWKLERGHQSGLDLARIGSVAAVVGLDVRLRAYPAGDAIRDAGQQRLLERLRREIHPSLRWRTEVPLPTDGDLRAWDAVVSGRGWSIAVEAETVLADVQAVERRLELKRRDAGEQVDQLILLVADTPRNRRALAGAPAAFGRLPGRTREAMAALRRGWAPTTDAIVIG